MPRMIAWALASGMLLAALIGVACPAGVDAHAAVERSEPAAGTSLTEPPAEIRITFTEPLESTYSGAELLDGAGEPVPDVAVSIAPANDHALVIVPAAPLPDGNYTVAWRTLSAADGHPLQGYFGFAVGTGFAGSPAVAAGAGNDAARSLSRGLALLGLAALLAIPPLSLLVFMPAARAVPGLESTVMRFMRRYAVAASLLAVLGSLAALGVQAATTARGESFLSGVALTLADTRYGALWQIRLLLLALVIGSVVVGFWGRPRQRGPVLAMGTVAAALAPLPFSLIAHVAAEREGRSAAVASDALHLLAASIWAGGLLMLVFVLAPALRPLSAENRRLALRAALPRFSVVALAGWFVMALSGLYAAWLQVGTLEALRTTAYGQTLVLKAALLVPVLGLAAFHFALGASGLSLRGAGRFVATIVAEALLVVAVLLVVGRLTGLEPAREILSARTSSQLTVPLSFAAEDGPRAGHLTISPGAAGVNDFLLEIEGAPLPSGAEGVLRFSAPNRDLGTQELILPMREPNVFHAQGAELALPGAWQVETIVRAIGVFSWATESAITVGQTPPPAPEPNPAPHFAPPAIAGMLAIVAGVLALAVALAGFGAGPRRAVVAALGVGALAVGSTVMAGSRLPAPTPILAPPPSTTPAPAASPSSEEHDDHHSEMMQRHASPAAGAATPLPLPGPGTPAPANGYTVELTADPAAAGPVDVTVILRADDGAPVAGARVAVLSEMPEMGMERTETRAVETAPGQYEAASVPLGMPGEWRLSVRISPRGEPTFVVPFSLTAS